MTADTLSPSTPPAGTLLDDEHIAFLRSGVSISVGSRDADCLPSLSRGVGCRIDAEGRLRVFVVADQSREVLDDIRANGAIAVVFSQPSTHRTVQVKGTDAIVESLGGGDLPCVQAYAEAFGAKLAALGYDAEFGRVLVDAGGGDVVALRFTPCAAFSQTPGPRAGEPLRETR